MLEEAIYKFKVSAPTLLPEIFDNFWLKSIKSFEDYAILPYEVHNPIPLDKVVTLLDEANIAILYHIVPDKTKVVTGFGQKCCAYFYPSLEQMYKINCQTEEDGLVHSIDVTVYDSLEDMAVEVRKDLRKNDREGTVFLTKRSDAHIMNDFSVHRWMNKSTFYHIADIIQEYRSWIEVIDTKRFIEMNIIQDGMLRPLQFQAITLRSTREHYSFKQSRIWNINEYDLSHALNKLCEKDPTARERAEQLKLTLEDVEYIIEKASFGIIKLELYNYDY